MEKATLKSVIIGLKMSGLSFAEISTRLRDDYNVEMSRQAVCGMYNRAMSKDKLNNSVAVAVMTTDVCRYSSLGLSVSEIKEIIDTQEFNLTINQIKGIIKNNKDIIDEMFEKYVDEAVKNIVNFEQTMEFNGVKPSEKVVYNIKERAAEKIFVRESKYILASLLNKGIDKSIIKNTAKMFNIASNISEIVH